VLKKAFLDYAEAYGQLVNPQKSSLYAGSISTSRLNFQRQRQGKAKYAYFQPLADKVKSKLSAWKASILSIIGRVQLVKSVVHSMLLHCLSIYSWPVKLLKDMKKWMRNFIWSGDVNQRKLVTIA